VDPYLSLLGVPQVRHAGLLTALRRERPCQLLALLALRRDWVPRPELAALFWPAQRRDLAAANLRKALHFARALPWAAALETQPSAVRFVVATDVHELAQASRDGRVADALQLCRGELLDGMEDTSNPAWTEWLDAERTQHARSWHELTRARLAMLEAMPEQAAELALRLLDADPLDEDAVVALLAAQRELGRFDEQRETYRSYALRLDDDLGVEPSARVREQLRKPAAAAASGEIFVGRARELDDVCALLTRGDCRLLSVVGPGGVGKSALLKQALRRLGSRFAGGALWIALDDLSDTGQVIARIATELKLAPGPQQDPLQLVCERLESTPSLLVLDNGEHLAGLPRLVERLLDRAPALTICVTSRARLAVPGERLLPLHGLALAPDDAPAAELLASDAARLFVAAARAAQAGFDARAEATTIGVLVAAVGGLPLAILLAAHWVRLLSVAEIVAELERSIDVLDSGDDGEERPEHRSMRATFERSWQMLATREQRTLAALSVFVGTFSIQAAREIADAALPLLAALADKSLLQMPAGGRCSLHPLIRQFAAEALTGDAAAHAARRHADWFNRLLARLATPAEAGVAAACDEIAAELENCRLAWRWAIAARSTGTLAAGASALMRYFEMRGLATDGALLLAEALPLCESPATPPAHAAELLSAIAHLEYRQYRLDEAAARARRGLKHARASARRTALVRCLNVLGLCHWKTGRCLDARRFLEQALRHARAGNDRHTETIVLGNLASVDKALGDYDRCLQRSLEVLEQQRRHGEWVSVAIRLNNLADLHQARGEWTQARACLDEGLELCRQHGIAFVRPHLLVNLAMTCFFIGDLDAAAQVGRDALAEARATANRNVEATALLHLVRVATRRGELATARGHLREAVLRANAMGSVPMQLDAVFCFAEIVAGEGEHARAAALMRWFIARPEIEPGDRAIAEAALAALPDAGTGVGADEATLAALLERLLDETAASAA